MQRDMDILRDLWNSIDPQSHIGRQSEPFTMAAKKCRRNQHDAVIERRNKARAEAQALRELGRPIPRKLE
jgi:hypothetical protein